MSLLNSLAGPNRSLTSLRFSIFKNSPVAVILVKINYGNVRFYYKIVFYQGTKYVRLFILNFPRRAIVSSFAPAILINSESITFSFFYTCRGYCFTLFRSTIIRLFFQTATIVFCFLDARLDAIRLTSITYEYANSSKVIINQVSAVSLKL